MPLASTVGKLPKGYKYRRCTNCNWMGGMKVAQPKNRSAIRCPSCRKYTYKLHVAK